MTRDRKSLIEEIVRFERSHEVAAYRVDGWNVWPLLRIGTALDAEHTAPPHPARETPGGTGTSSGRDGRGRASHLAARLRRWARPHTIDPDRSRRPSAPARAVLVTTSNRRERVGPRLWHRFADPLEAALRAEGHSVLTWEAGAEQGPRHGRSAWIAGRLDAHRWWRTRLQRPEPSDEPSWFSSCRSWMEDLTGRPAPWAAWAWRLRLIGDMSARMRRWLHASRTRTVFVDCWYDWPSAAATLAARRLGLRTVEVQHGLQGPVHPGYAHWTRVPEAGFEVHPDWFWVWGAQDRDNLVTTWERPPKTVVGGSPWLNLWDARDDAAPRVPRSRPGTSPPHAVVTLQPAAPHGELAEAVSASPAGWRWTVRLHPRMAERSREPSAWGLPPRCRVVAARDGPLPALLTRCDVHLTGFSTCALEALRFGKPTVLFHPTGAQAFAGEIAAGLMRTAVDSREILAAATTLPHEASAGACRERARLYFAGRASMRAAVGAIMDASCSSPIV